MQKIDFGVAPQPEQVDPIAEWLALGNYRVIRPLQPCTPFTTSQPPEKLITVAILDTETTGMNFGQDKIIELGMVLVELCPETGQAYRVVKVFDELEDPGIPIPMESTRVHHITDEMVSGKRIDEPAINDLMARVSLVIAHNASFDRLFVEKRFPIFASKAWACSLRQIPWSEEGFGSASLEFLAYRCGFHFTGHRATTDCFALLEVLQKPLPTSGLKAMQILLQNASVPDVQVAALGSPFESKDVLKERAYRWNAEERVWAKNVSKQRLGDEVAWLKSFVYAGKSFRLKLERMTAMNRFSNRPGAVEVVTYE